MNLLSAIESLLLISSKPLSLKKLSEFLNSTTENVSAAASALKEKYNQQNSGIQIMENHGEIQFMTNPDNAALIKEYIKDEATGELTRPALEALTIISYRGPITKLELEQIRGVNCSLILRNLLMRGLVKEEEDAQRGQLVYILTFDFLKFLGLQSVQNLPNYDKLHGHDLVERLLEMQQQEENSAIR